MQCLGRLSQSSRPVDLAVVFYSTHHVAESMLVAERVRAILQAQHVIGVATDAVIGGGFEFEGVAGISILAASLPGAELLPVSSEHLPMLVDSPEGRDAIRASCGGADGLRGLILLADPFSTPVVRMLPAMNEALLASDGSVAPIVGGMASSGKQAGENSLISALGEPVQSGGFVGIALRGRVMLDTIVSQGCAPLGANLVITKAHRNLIQELGGRNAVEVVAELLQAVPEERRGQVRGGLCIGRVIDEYKSQHGRGDYLIREILGVEETTKSLAVGDLVRTGQTVRFHVRDAVTAREDLQMLLDVQRLHGQPAGCMLVTGSQRGERMFGRPNADAGLVAGSFGPELPGERRAKVGHAIDTEPGPVPLAGFMAAGEFGPIGGRSYLHRSTAIATLLRQAP